MLYAVLALALSAAPGHAQELLVPEFTPAIAEDFTLAFMFGSLVGDALREHGVDFADGDELRAMAGEDANLCAESISCPSALWAYYPGAKIAIVGTVGLTGPGTPEESIQIGMTFYARDAIEPVKTVERSLVPGQEGEFADAIARAAALLVQQSASLPVQAREGGTAGGGDGGGEPAPRSGPFGWIRRARGAPPERGAAREEEPRAVVVDTGPREREERPRAKRRSEGAGGRVRVGGGWRGGGERDALQLEVATGLALGDTARAYDVRVAYADRVGAEVGRYQHDAFTPGLGWTLGLGAFGSPGPWLRAGARVGLQTGRKYLSTGYERWYEGGLRVSDVQAYEPSPALRGVIEPRVELMPVALGSVRPAATALMALRYYDAFVVEDLVDVEFPDRPSGWQIEPGFALGARWDLGGGRAVGAQIGHTWRLGAGTAHHVQRGLLGQVPSIPEEAGGGTFLAVSFTQGFLRSGGGS